ncbi:hypothetical protein B0H15DRAFT_927606 [Mycena belliarum]|uniref:RRM domain-containing protein n=1 Tax=Mycena belliarum TaxID=1033014 RepID=A0AAD6UGU5_9AGAR|nr:hypothetical protein B0H15DRAFT_927606 [Mycena belliae]
MTNSLSLSGPIFKFSRETNAVRVENIPQNVNRLEVLALFSTLIGDIRASQDSEEALEITFFTADSARKALCMSGYNVAGAALLVSPIMRTASPAPFHGASQGRRTDIRRNLYVLGVPFGMTNQSLATLFAPYGTVSHCVILATLDGASRRRGFVVMSTHEEARAAMTALGRTSKGGGGMDVSWAVVQRSKGFLDGGDRAGVVHPPSSLSSPSPALGSHLPADSPALPSLSAVPTSTLLLTSLPSLLFGSEDDLRGLVCPFGRVKTLRMVTLPASSPFSVAPAPAPASAPASLLCSLPPSSSTPAPVTPTTAAIVEYMGPTPAQEARRSLNGESYAGCTVRVSYLIEPEDESKSEPESPLPETPIFPAQLSFPPPFFPAGVPRCGLPPYKASFDGRDVGNHALGYVHPGRQWEGLQHQPLYATSPLSPFEVYSGHGLGNMGPRLDGQSWSSIKSFKMITTQAQTILPARIVVGLFTALPRIPPSDNTSNNTTRDTFSILRSSSSSLRMLTYSFTDSANTRDTFSILRSSSSSLLRETPERSQLSACHWLVVLRENRLGRSAQRL